MAQCKAKSKQTKKRCRRPAIKGGNVCRHHGGGAPQVKRKAAERLALLVDPALDALTQLVKAKRQPRVRLGAARDILDRTGYAPVKSLKIKEERDEPFEFTLKIDPPGAMERLDVDSSELTGAEVERFRELLDRFESGSILTAVEQREVHELRQRAGRKPGL